MSGFNHWKIKLKILQELLIQNLILYCENFNKWFWQKIPSVLRDHEQKHIFHLGLFLTYKCNMEIMIEKSILQFLQNLQVAWDTAWLNSRVNESLASRWVIVQIKATWLVEWISSLTDDSSSFTKREKQREWISNFSWF